MGKTDLEELRRQIDETDRKILDLLNQRQTLSHEIGKFKKNNGVDRFDPGREREILDRLNTLNQGPLIPMAVRRIYREIFSASRAAQTPISVGYLGPEATFSHEAALSQFGRSAELLAQPSLKEVFRGVDRERFTYGVVPVENSSQGGVGETLDLFLEYDLKVCLEIRLQISHNLMSKARTLRDVKKIYSHPQVFSQCAQWLAANLPGVPLIESSSTSAAAREAAKDDNSAAIAGSIAADIYDLDMLVRAIEDSEQNVTRFLVLSHSPGPRTGRDKTSLILSVKDEPGALFNLLKPLANGAINMTKIESRPMKDQAWRYVFFIDIEGHLDDAEVQATLEETKNRSQWLKILGSYPRVD